MILSIIFHCGVGLKDSFKLKVFKFKEKSALCMQFMPVPNLHTAPKRHLIKTF